MPLFILSAISSAPSLSALLTTVLTSSVVTTVGILIKDQYDAYVRSRSLDTTRESVMLRRRGNSFHLTSVSEMELIINIGAVDDLKAILRCDFYGVLVIGAPAGSGKSTYLSLALSDYRKAEKGVSVFYIENLRKDALASSAGVPSGDTPSHYLPENSLVIIDQVDMREDELSSELQQYIVSLATNSRNSKRYRVILVVSSPKTCAEVLKLNGGEKIALAMDPIQFKWTPDQIRQLFTILVGENKLMDKNMDAIIKLCEKSACAGLVIFVSHFLKFNECDRVTAIEGKLKELVEQRLQQWDEYATSSALPLILRKVLQ